MRIAVFSDIHSNLEALSAVLKEAGTVDRYLCLGDIVGYGANPNEVIQLVKRHEMLTVKGNHEDAVLTGDAEGFNPTARFAAEWTSENLSKEGRAFLEGLPLQLDISLEEVRIHMVHGSPENPLEEYIFPNTAKERLQAFLRITNSQLLLLGHTHVPMNAELEDGRVVNPGSVGQPRDGDRRASFAILKINGGLVECSLLRVEYDIEKAAGKILDAGLPRLDAERLYQGF